MHADIDYERLYRDTIPSVVSVYVGRGAPARGAGSGFVYDRTADATDEEADGYVVTNEHVVTDATDVEIRFADGQWRTGRVVGRDTYTDLAVVRVPDLPRAARPLPVASENPRPGRPVAALGNPLGLDGSITAGIVSGSNRSMRTSSGFAIPDVVQTDAPINPGNSGGPLVALVIDGSDDGDHQDEAGDDVVDERADSTGVTIEIGERADGTEAADSETETDSGSGFDSEPETSVSGDGPDERPDLRYEVVGVNRARQGDNIGFAVSPVIVSRVVPSLIEDGRYRHSYLRTRTLDVTPTIAAANGLDEPRGVLVVDVATGPTAGERLRRSTETRTLHGQRVPVGGDVIVGINGHEIHTHEELMRYLITETRPHEPVGVDVVRDGVPQTLDIVLGERPDPDGRIPVN